MSWYYYDVTKPLFVGTTLLCAYISGHIATDSRSGIATKLSAPSDLAALRGWHEMYLSGRRTNPPLAGLAALCAFGAAAAHHHPQAPLRAVLFVAAGVSALAIAPWTFTAMAGTNARLMQALDEAERDVDGKGAAKSDEVQGLLRTWGALNWARSAFPMVGALCAMEAL